MVKPWNAYNRLTKAIVDASFSVFLISGQTSITTLPCLMEPNPAEIQPKAFFMEIKMPPFAFFFGRPSG